MRIDCILGYNDELRQVEGIGTFPDDLPLGTTLTSVIEEGTDILKRLALPDTISQGLCRGKRLTVP